MKNRTVVDVMSEELARSAMPLEEFARVPAEHHGSAAPALHVDDRLPAPVGAAARRRRWWLLRRLPSRTVGQVMFTRPVVVRPDADVAEAVQLMADHGVTRLPVVDDRGRLAGVVSRSDLVTASAGARCADVRREESRRCSRRSQMCRTASTPSG